MKIIKNSFYPFQAKPPQTCKQAGDIQNCAKNFVLLYYKNVGVAKSQSIVRYYCACVSRFQQKKGEGTMICTFCQANKLQDFLYFVDTFAHVLELKE